MGRASGCANTAGAIPLSTPKVYPIRLIHVNIYGRLFSINKPKSEVGVVRLKELEGWLSPADVMGVLGWSRQGVVNLANQGRVRAVRTRIGYLYDPKDVQRFKKEGRDKA